MRYAVIDQSGDLIDRDLTTEQAAHEILTVDGQEYEIRLGSAGDYWILWGRQEVANRPWEVTRFSTWGTRAEARAAIFAHVVKKADGGRYWKAEAIPQAKYDETQARLAAEAGE